MDIETGALVALRLAPARAYRELLYRPTGDLSQRIGERYEVVARPGQTLPEAPRAGDVLLSVTLGEPGGGQCDVLDDDNLIRRSSARAASAGWYCMVNGTVPRPRRVLDTSRRVPPGQLLLRARAVDSAPVATPTRDIEDDAELLDEDRPCACTRCLTESGHPADDEDERETYGVAGDLADDELSRDAAPDESATVIKVFEDTRDDEASPAPVLVDSAAAVPPFDTAERAVVLEPLLTPAESASAVAWSTANHPAVSGIALADINAALGDYVDAAAVQAAILRLNTLDPARPIDATSPLTAPVVVECVHQFQRKCYLDPHQHDGKAGESTLDSLGLIARTGMRTARKRHEGAHQRLIDRDKKVQAATAGEFSAANWFARMIDPSVFGWTTKSGSGLHVVLVRKLRQAERYLLTLGSFRGMTPARLGTALGLTELHGGVRPEDPTADMHTFGLAIDISYTANPWIHSESSWRALKRAASLITGTNLAQSSVGVYLSGLATGAVRSTGEVSDELHQRNDELIAYLSLDKQTLEATLSDRAQGWATPVVTPGEPIDDAVRQWSANISEDNRDLDAGDFNGHLPAKDGFLTHPRDLVIALRDHGCLAWGAVDFGPSAEGSGDMMHFDARVDGVGRVLSLDTAMWVPALDHHPCLPAATRSATEMELSEEQLPTILHAPVVPNRQVWAGEDSGTTATVSCPPPTTANPAELDPDFKCAAPGCLDLVGVRPFRKGTYKLKSDTTTVKTKFIVHNYGHGGAGITMSWGCAFKVLDLVQGHQPSGNVAVLGAGVMGLTAATLLREAGYDVHIYAASLQWTTSDVAGGQFCPSRVEHLPTKGAIAEFEDILKKSFNEHCKRIGQGFGVSRRVNYSTKGRGTDFDRVPPEIIPPPQKYEHLPFSHLNVEGYGYQTLLIEPPIFLSTLRAGLSSPGATSAGVSSAGVIFTQCMFHTPGDIEKLKEPIVINCTGMGAGKLFSDEDMVPIKGQLVLVKPQPALMNYLYSSGDGVYVFPRTDHVVVGGSFAEGVDNYTLDPREHNRILEKAKAVFAGRP
jgi:hypothetical protein